jgi:hypothetical protein
VLDEPLLLAPESLTDVATRTPLAFLRPCTTTVSPGRTEFLDTARLFEIFAADDSVTFSTFPELSLTYKVRPSTLLTCPTVLLAPPKPPASAATPAGSEREPVLAPAAREPVAPAAASEGTVKLELDPLSWLFSIRTPA